MGRGTPVAGVLPHVILGGDLNCLPETGAVQVPGEIRV